MGVIFKYPWEYFEDFSQNLKKMGNLLVSFLLYVETLNLGVIFKYPWEYFEDFSQISKKLWENIRNVSTDA